MNDGSVVFLLVVVLAALACLLWLDWRRQREMVDLEERVNRITPTPEPAA